MSVQIPRHATEHRIELPADVVEAIADELAGLDEPTVDDARDAAFDAVDRRTEFVTEDGETLAAAVERRLSN